MDINDNEKNSLEKKESLINFPEKFPIKVFGIDSDEFKKSIAATINEKIKPEDLLHWKENKSSKGNYLAITVTIMAQNQEQLDTIYFGLTENPLVKMAL